MTKFIRNLLLIAIMLFSVGQSFAQEISPENALKLVQQNSLRLGLSPADIENTQVSSAYIDKVSGLQLIYLQQSYQGVPVFNSIQVIALKNDKVVSNKGDRITDIDEKSTSAKALAAISAKQAVSFAARALNMNVSDFASASLSVLKSSNNNRKVEFALSGISQENITSELLWLPDEQGKVNLTWQVKILPPNSSDYWLMFMDANNGIELSRMNLTKYCDWDNPADRKMHSTHNNGLSSDVSLASKDIKIEQKKPLTQSLLASNVTANYTVIPFGTESPDKSGFAQVANPWLLAGAGNNSGTLGWHNDGLTDYKYTRGNNVWAKDDHAKKNNTTGTPATSTTNLPDLNFNFTLNDDNKPEQATNLSVANTNLFYWNNIMHDLSYQYGFDEVSGNFQKDNMGRGGQGNDFVWADAQDGSSRNNANFSPPADGSNGRMQMFLFDGVNKKLFKVITPAAIAGIKTAVESGFSTANKLADLGSKTGDIVLYMDSQGSLNQGCSTPTNANQVLGKIALIDRGDCGFVGKAKNAQTAGAIAVVIANNDQASPDAVIPMGGTDNTIVIPAVMISYNDGVAIKAQLADNKAVNVTLSGDKAIDLDGDLDNGIVAHEYGHGISTRLTGGPANSGCLSNKEEGGEGWSDYFALMVTTDWTTAQITDGPNPRPMGTYVMGQNPVTGSGIRLYPYSTDMSINQWTYAGVKTSGGEVHDIGEIWAATLWDMTWNLIQMDGINPDLYNADGTGGNSVSMKLVMLGLKLQNCSPGFLDARDGILKADQVLYDGKYSCAIWNAFARRGMGVNAIQGNPESTNDQTENFETPTGAMIVKTVDKENAAQGEVLTYSFKVKARCTNISNFKVVDTLPANLTYVSGGTYNNAKHTVTFNIPTLAASQSQTFTFKATVKPGSYLAETSLLSETVPANSIPATLVATSNKSTKWVGSTQNHSAPYSLKATGNSKFSEQILTSANSYPVTAHTELSFWQGCATQERHDGGVVELSIDNGTTWMDAGPYMSQNGYNTIIGADAKTNLSGLPAFSGDFEFQQTIVDLSSFNGANLLFRFRFVTDNFVLSTGWFVDDISIVNRGAVNNIVNLFTGSDVFEGNSGAVTVINSAVLPLAWGTFTAEKRGNVASLNWNTLQEVNTAEFIVERGVDGIHFSEIGRLNAAGTSNRTLSYITTDESPETGVNYYRVKQTDRDGNYSYSAIRSLTFEGGLGFISIAPNPSKGGVVVLNITGNKTTLQVALLNTAGQVIRKYNVNKEKNDLLLPSLASGVYYLKITGENISSMQRLVIEK